MLSAAFARGDQFVVVDRLNHIRSQRGNYLALAKKNGYQTKVVWFNVDRETCIKRVKQRKRHPTLPPERAEEAIMYYFKSFQAPSTREAIDEIEIIGGKPDFVPVKDICAEIGDRRYIIVGDIHGCLDELQGLLKDLNFNPLEDVLVSAGDLVDRGPKVKETLEYVMSLPRFYAVCGNHDDKCVRYFSGNNVKIAHGLQNTIDSFDNKMPVEVREYLRNLPLILKTPKGYVVHAGFDPMMPAEQQRPDDCLYMRYYGGRSYFDAENGELWYKLWPKDAPRVFYGHIAEASMPVLPNIVSLDGGCVFGDYLKAYDSQTDMVHYFKAAQVYSQSAFQEASISSPNEEISKREEYVVAGLIRKDMTDDEKLSIYTYTDQCTFDRAWDSITKNSRGHIFDMTTGECVAFAFPKFFNLGENEDSLFEKLDWNQPYYVLEKLDGWLGVLYRHEGVFKVASRGSFHSDGALWATNHIRKFDLSFLPEEATLLFEIINPKQRIILDYGGMEALVILAAYNRMDRTEYPRATVEEWAKKSGLPIVKRHEVTVQDCLRIQKDANIKGQEGFVIVFEDGRRVKVKTEWYCTLAKIMSKLSPISIWETMKSGKVQRDFLVKVPEELRPLAEQYVTILEGQYALVRENTVAKCLPLIEECKRDPKTIAENRKKLEGTVAYRAVFSVLKGKERDIDKVVMDAIYPSANEFVALNQ